MRYDFPIAYVRELRIRCDKIGVKSTPDFWKASPLRLTEAFNEIGPERWCLRFEKLVKYLGAPFFIAALQHDWETSRPYKSWSMLTSMNIRFIYNVLQEAIEQKTLKLVFYGNFTCDAMSTIRLKDLFTSVYFRREMTNG